MDGRVSLAEDMVIGADQIAIELYGSNRRSAVRDVYRNPLGLTFFKHGGFLAARKSTLRQEVAEIEGQVREARKAAREAA